MSVPNEQRLVSFDGAFNDSAVAFIRTPHDSFRSD